MEYIGLGAGLFDSRQAVWIAAQLHLNFAAFVLAVPLFVMVIEFLGWRGKQERYDRLAHELTRLLPPAYAFTAITGGIMGFSLFVLFPKVMNYLSGVFSPIMLLYPVLFLVESALLYFYCYTWDSLQGNKKAWHLLMALGLNLIGTAVMFIANSWASFMMSPEGVSPEGQRLSLWAAMNNPTWWPLNIHRFVANITFGALLCGAYAAFRFLGAKDERQRAYYDWMGFTGNFIALFTMLFLPFLGYWFGFEIYRFSAQMGITLMGGFLSWLFVLQAIVIAFLFIGTAYYQWIGLARIPGAERYRRWIPVFLVLIIAAFAVWSTPRTMVFGPADPARHSFSNLFGLMAPKMAAVNGVLLILYISWMFYRRAGKEIVQRGLNGLSWAIVFIGGAGVIAIALRGYFIPVEQRIVESWYQIGLLTALFLSTFILDTFALRGARVLGNIEWGKVPRRSQYILVALAIIIVWLIGLMGYARSAVRTNWHVSGLLEDTSPWAWLPALGGAANMVTLITLIFFGLLGLTFVLSTLSVKEREEVPEVRMLAQPVGNPHPKKGGKR